MSYQSPIEVITSQMRITSEIRLGEEIVKAVQNVGVNVDKAELLKALRYDREQYQKGYKDRENKIIRCKDCKLSSPSAQFCYEWYQPTRPNGYCHKAQKKDGEQE